MRGFTWSVSTNTYQYMWEGICVDDHDWIRANRCKIRECTLRSTRISTRKSRVRRGQRAPKQQQLMENYRKLFQKSIFIKASTLRALFVSSLYFSKLEKAKSSLSSDCAPKISIIVEGVNSRKSKRETKKMFHKPWISFWKVKLVVKH